MCWNSVKDSSETFLVVNFDVSYSIRNKQWDLHCSSSQHSPSWCTHLISFANLHHIGESAFIIFSSLIIENLENLKILGIW